MKNHEEERENVLEDLAYDAFREAHDHLVDKKQEAKCENLKGIYAKSRGYLVRLALIKDALEQAVSIVTLDGDDQLRSWSLKVSESSVKASAAMINHFNRQKEIIMGNNQGTFA